jgi:hypothetical protein
MPLTPGAFPTATWSGRNATQGLEFLAQAALLRYYLRLSRHHCQPLVAFCSPQSPAVIADDSRISALGIA